MRLLVLVFVCAGLAGCVETAGGEGSTTVTETHIEVRTETVTVTRTITASASTTTTAGNSAPDVAFATDENADRITLVKGASGLEWSDFQLRGIGASSKWMLNDNAAASSKALTGGYEALPAEPFNAGDFLDFCGGSGPLELTLRHIDSNTIVFETTLSSIVAC